MEPIDVDQLQYVTGGDGIRRATFGALSLMNAFGGDPSNSVAKSLGPRPSITQPASPGGQSPPTGGGGGPKGPFQMGPFSAHGTWGDIVF
jgi:hypothetical protein